jgi:hypothetical protein
MAEIYLAILVVCHDLLLLQGLTNPLARRPGLVISTFGLAEIISCMPDGLVNICIGYWQTCQYSRIYLLVHLDQRSMWTIAITWRPSSVVCKLFTFQASSPKPLGRLEPNLAGMFLGWSSTKLLFFVAVGYSIWLPGPIICSDWLKFQRSSSLKLMNWLNPNYKWMIIGRSSTKFLFFMPIGNPRWPPSQDID